MIELKNINCTFKNNHTLFNDFNFSVADGDFVVIMGDNGAGKSTLVNIISGSLPFQSGEVYIHGENVTKQNEHKRTKRIAKVFQDPKIGTCPIMTVRENLAITLNKGKHFSLSKGVDHKNDKLIKEALAELNMGLENMLDKKLGELSGGQRQAVSLVMASLSKPDLLLLDEHTAALDPQTSRQVMALTEKIVRENKLTTIMITHSIPFANAHGDRLVFMRAGKVAVDVRDNEKRAMTEKQFIGMFEQV